MTYEILYTSAPAGLKPGSSGYCTVKGSRGIPSPTLDLLESLSGYRHVFTPGTPEAAYNPVNWGHYLLRISGRMEHVLSRVSDCEPDYTGRSNKLAHHMVVDDAACPAGPAWLLGQRGWMTERWDGQVEQLSSVRTPPAARRAPGRCVAWEGLGLDPGWAGVMAESFLTDPDRKVFVIYKPGTNILPLFEEALSLLPENRRWDVTFATYGAALPSTVDCLWSGIVAGSPEVQQSRRFVNALRIDLTRPEPAQNGGALVDLARTGVARKASPPPARSTPQRPVAPPIELAEVERPEPSQRRSPVPPPPDTLWEPEPPSLPDRNSGRSGTKLPWVVGSIATVALLGAVITVIYLKLPKSQPAVATEPIAQSGKGPRAPGDIAPGEGENESSKGGKEPAAAAPPPMPPMPPMPPPASDPPKTGESMPPADAAPPSPPSSNDDTGGKATVPPTGSEKEEPLPKTQLGHDKKKPSAVSQLPTIVAVSQPTIGRPSAPTRIRLPKGVKLNFTDVTYPILMLPRDRADGNVSSFYSLVGQITEGKGCMIKSNTGSVPQLTCEVEIDTDGGLAIEITPKAELPAEHKHCIELGALQLRNDERGDTAFVHFCPRISGNGPRPQLSAKSSILLPIPGDLRQHFKVLRGDDVVVADIELALADSPIPSMEGDKQNWRWDVSGVTGNVFHSLSVSKTATLPSADNIRLACVCQPTYDEVKIKVNEKLVALELKHPELIKDTPGVDPDGVLVPNHKVALDMKKLEAAATQLKSRHKQVKEKQAGEKKETVAASVHEEFDRSVNEYVTSLTDYKRGMSAIEAMDSEISVTAVNVGYKVFAIRLPKRTKTAADEYPRGHEQTVIEAWSYRAKQ